MGYKEDISIDKHDMENECAGHPSIHFEYGKKHADALRERRLAELEEQEEQAAADGRVRASSLDGKFTETAIRRQVEQDPKYQEACRKALDAAYEVNVLAAALEALNAKTKMLGNVLQMQLAHWQSEPRGARELAEKTQEQSREEQLEGLKSEGDPYLKGIGEGSGRKKGGMKKI